VGGSSPAVSHRQFVDDVGSSTELALAQTGDDHVVPDLGPLDPLFPMRSQRTARVYLTLNRMPVKDWRVGGEAATTQRVNCRPSVSVNCAIPLLGPIVLAGLIPFATKLSRWSGCHLFIVLQLSQYNQGFRKACSRLSCCNGMKSVYSHEYDCWR
jgi:hypothetical protein